jgi:hypothetical protein
MKLVLMNISEILEKIGYFLNFYEMLKKGQKRGQKWLFFGKNRKKTDFMGETYENFKSRPSKSPSRVRVPYVEGYFYPFNFMEETSENEKRGVFGPPIF